MPRASIGNRSPGCPGFVRFPDDRPRSGQIPDIFTPGAGIAGVSRMARVGPSACQGQEVLGHGRWARSHGQPRLSDAKSWLAVEERGVRACEGDTGLLVPDLVFAI